jgi:hypothetical protein
MRRLLRWYPRAWRERYGEEFLAVVEDTLDGRRPGWRLRLAVAWAGLRERGHQARRTGGRVLPGLARGFTADSGWFCGKGPQAVREIRRGRTG